MQLSLMTAIAGFVWLVVEINVHDRRRLRSLSPTQRAEVQRQTTEMLYW